MAKKIKFSRKEKSAFWHLGFSVLFTFISMALLEFWDLFICWFVGVNIFTFLSFGLDKFYAVIGAQNSRTPESSFHMLGVLGAFPAILLGRILFNHKTSKAEFYRVMWVLFILQIALVYVYVQGNLL